MEKMQWFFCLFILLIINQANSLDLSPAAIAKTIHEGAYEAVKETVNTVTEVVGTPVDIKDVHFYLHTSKDHGYPNNTVDPLNPSQIATRNGKIYFLIHGWTQTRHKTPWYKPLTEYILKKHPEAHVVQVDWGKAAANIYASAAFCTESVGNIIGDVLHKLVVEYNVPPKNFVVIGHSLGGQISGWVGKRFRQLTKSTLPRIIALDPAGPLFSTRPEEKRLNKHDAEVVMVLHSDGGKLGFGDNCGSIDFFPNGGSDQPGCYKVDLADVSTLTEPIWCDHQRGYNLFLEAVKSPCLFVARKCGSYENFKENKCENVAVSLGDLEATSVGSYYFNTTDTAPFIGIEERKRNERILMHATKSLKEKCSQLSNREEFHNDGSLKMKNNRDNYSNGNSMKVKMTTTYNHRNEHKNPQTYREDMEYFNRNGADKSNENFMAATYEARDASSPNSELLKNIKHSDFVESYGQTQEKQLREESIHNDHKNLRTFGNHHHDKSDHDKVSMRTVFSNEYKDKSKGSNKQTARIQY